MNEWIRCFLREAAWFGDQSGLDLLLRSMFIGLVVYCLNSVTHNRFK